MKMKGETEQKGIPLRILVLGGSREGKTCLIERYINGTYKVNYIATI